MSRPPEDPIDKVVRRGVREVAERRGVEPQLVLSELAIERLLYRLGRSRHAERFVLKGATLFRLWTGEARRATWDLDLEGFGSRAVDDVVAALREVAQLEAVDGVEFDVSSIRGEEIRAPDEYGGVRVRFDARIGEARLPVQVDVGFGDAIVPPADWASLPALLEQEAPRVRVYPKEAVVAEKLEAIVSLGVRNSRMKDFYDLERLAAAMAFDGALLANAVRATFDRTRNGDLERRAPRPAARVHDRARTSSPMEGVLAAESARRPFA